MFMKNSKLLIVLLAACCCFSAYGQEKYENQWFGGAGAGMNFGINRFNHDHMDRENSHRGAGTAVDIWAGKRINDWFGIRAGYQGLGISNRYTEYGAYPYHYFHADAMLMYNRFIMPYAHVGFAKIDRGTPAAGVGVMLPIHLSNTVSLVPDVKVTAFSDKRAWQGEKGLAANISATVGLAVNLARQRARKPVEIEYVAPAPEPAPVPETPQIVVVRDTVVVHRVDTVIVQPTLEEVSEQFTERIAGVALFDFDRFNVRGEAQPVLREIADWMNENPERSILIEGYTDQRGTDAYNLTLSQRRADAIRDQLIAYGVAANRITAIGHGKGNFNIGTTTEEIHQQNRRTVITVR